MLATQALWYFLPLLIASVARATLGEIQTLGVGVVIGGKVVDKRLLTLTTDTQHTKSDAGAVQCVNATLLNRAAQSRKLEDLNKIVV